MIRSKQLILSIIPALVLAAMMLTTSSVQAADISGLRMWDAPDNTRIVFDLSKPTGYSVFTLKKPDRVVIDLSESRLKTDVPGLANNHRVLKSIRASQRKKKDFRIVLDMKSRVQPNAFFLKPNDQYGHRLVVDLPHPELAQDVSEVLAQIASPEEPRRSLKKDSSKPRDIVIAIDAGHGGEDPGAHGRRYGTREKDVVLSIAKKLEKLIKRTPGMRPVMIRDGDYYVGLRKRINRARKHKADLFVSIHADAYKNPRVSGSSVYVLSARGASDEASRWLEARENAADLVGGVSLDDKDDVLASVLLDLSMSGTIDMSTRVASNVLKELGGVGPVRKKDVQYARFVVLKSPDIPSMLIETAFISNPREEKRLRSHAYQQKMASGILRGVKTYFKANPPPGTRFADAGREHRIRKGETLSSIADRYSIHPRQLRQINQLSSSLIQVGQVLRIP